MKRHELFARVSGRGLRVAVLTALLTTVACACESDNPIADCFAEVFNAAPCLVASGRPIKYVPSTSDCTSCDSPCRDVEMVTVSPQLKHYCVPSCKFLCP